MARHRTRRAYLAALGAGATAALAGCGSIEQRVVGQPSVVEDPPAAVYYPSHVEGMAVVGQRAVGDRAVAVFYSYPHRFWTVSGARTTRVDVSGDLHLMVAVWDPETGTALPVGSGLRVRIERDGETVASRAPWPMLSQPMGYHFGDNVSLPGQGRYRVVVETGGLSLRRRGAFAGRFGDPVDTTFRFQYSRAAREDVPYRLLPDSGERGAVEPMDAPFPLSVAPAPDALPGRVLGSATSGDAHVVATALPDGYLAVSLRTPYNRYALPLAALSATLSRGDETVFEGRLTKAIGPDLGYHYGASAGAVRAGDELTVRIDAPPQVSRHEGYETAFLEASPVSLSV
ncbi:MAG: hypothetical protein ABEJ89_02790 [Haloarculaceae archaeon]